MMGIYLSFVGSASRAYKYETTGGSEIFPDENFAREIMELFSVGLCRLNADGTQQRDSASGGDCVETYANADVENYARAWTGFWYQDMRGNIEYSGVNTVDPMRHYKGWRDVFPKTDLEVRHRQRSVTRQTRGCLFTTENRYHRPLSDVAHEDILS